MIHLQVELMGPGTCCFSYLWVQLTSPERFFDDKSAIPLLLGTRKNNSFESENKI